MIDLLKDREFMPRQKLSWWIRRDKLIRACASLDALGKSANDCKGSEHFGAQKHKALRNLWQSRGASLLRGINPFFIVL
jgi:hypothetical protein